MEEVKERSFRAVFSKLFTFLKGRLWIDELYAVYLERIQKPLAEIFAFADTVILRGLVVRGSAGLVGILGIGLRLLQVGRLNSYVLWFSGFGPVFGYMGLISFSIFFYAPPSVVQYYLDPLHLRAQLFAFL